MERERYHTYVMEGMSQGRQKDLVGGGLIRSGGGWAAVRMLCKAEKFHKSDERILGDGDFVELGFSMIEISKRLEISLPTVSVSVQKVRSLSVTRAGALKRF